MFMGFIYTFILYTFISFFGTNLLTRGPARIAVFCLFQYIRGKEYQMKSKRNETFGSDLFGTNVIRGTWSGRQATEEASTRVEGVPPASWAPRASIDLLFPPIYTHVPRKNPGAPQNTISTVVTFCIREIPSWSLRRRSTGGGINHGGPLHHLQGLSNEL